MNHRRKTDKGRLKGPRVGLKGRGSTDEEIAKAPIEINVCGGALRVLGFINDMPSKFIIDTGADVTMVSTNLFDQVALTNNADICPSSGVIKV